ncbi:MAG: LysR family transcriptional regulator [Opitutus sp.]|nr:LysR family transcriptional regulator [Opitutus sp.]
MGQPVTGETVGLATIMRMCLAEALCMGAKELPESSAPRRVRPIQLCFRRHTRPVWPGMELRHLRYFTTVARTLNFSQAARELHLAQPPLSAQIKSLEHELGVQLFARSSRGVALTQAGQAFLPKALDALRAAERAGESARSLATGRTDELRIGIIPPALTAGIAARVQAFHSAHPHLRLTFRTGGAADLHAALKHGEIDVAVTRPPAASPALRERLLERHELLLAIPARHPLARRRAVPWPALDGVRALLLNPAANPHYGQFFLHTCARHGARPVIDYAADDLGTLVWLVSAGLGVCPYPSSLAAGVPTGVVVLPFKPRHRQMELVAIWRADSVAACAALVAELARL